MQKLWRLTAFVGIAVLALIAALSAGAAGNPHTTYTCTKVKRNGDTEIHPNVPESAVGGQTTAGFTCTANSGEQSNDPTDHGNQGDQGDQGEQGDQDQQGDQSDQGGQDQQGDQSDQ